MHRTRVCTTFSSHFKDHQLPLPPELNSAEPFLPPTLAAAPEIDDSPPSLEEIRTIVEKFKVRKAEGSDDLVNELFYSNLARASNSHLGV